MLLLQDAARNGVQAQTAPTEVYVGGLYAMEYTNVRERASHFRLALDRINNKADGWFDDILPNTVLRYVIDNSGCSRSVALEGAAKQGTPCMQGVTRTPVVATVGATCSGASMSAQDLLKIYKIPMVSYSATSPDLSDKTLYPYFLRTVPSDVGQGKGIVDLAKNFGVKRMGLLASDGAYGLGLANQFRGYAQQSAIDNPSSAYKTVSAYQEVASEAKVDLSMICKVRDLAAEGVRHVFLATQSHDSHYFGVTAIHSGYFKGDDFMFYAPDSWSNDASMQIFEADVSSWFYKPKADTIGGYYTSSLGGDIIPLYDSGTALESVNVNANCIKITGTIDQSRASVTLDGIGDGSIEHIGEDGVRITWATGEVWTRITPPSLVELEAFFYASVGLTPSTFGPLLQDYLDTIWTPKNPDYDFDNSTQNIAHEYFESNGEELGWTDGDGDRTTVHPYGPPSFDAATAVALAIHAVIEAGDDPTDGEKLLAALMDVEFDGLSGKVSFDANGDRDGSRYTILNRRYSDESSVGLLEGATITFDKAVVFPGTKTEAPVDGTCALSDTITQYCSGRGTCNFGPGTCTCAVGYGGANCEVEMPPPCTMQDFGFTVSSCNTDNDRLGVYYYLNGAQSCCNPDNFGDLCTTGLLLPTPIKVECDYVKEDSAVAQAFIALATIAIVFQLALLGAVVYYKDNALMRRSQPIMQSFAIIGSMLGISSIYMFVGERDTALCRTVPTVLTLGFTLMYSSLAVKMYRIDVLFNNKNMKLVTMGVRQMMLILGFIVGADLIAVLLFVFVDNVEASTTYDSVQGVLIPYFECVSSTGSPLGIVLLFMKIVLLCYGLLLGFRVRNAPSDYQEVKVIVMGVYNTALSVIVVMPMYFYLDLDRDVRFILASCGILYAFNGATAMIVIPKIYHIIKGDIKVESALMNVAQSQKVSSLQSMQTAGTQGTKDDDYKDRLLKEKDEKIAELKKELEKAMAIAE